MEAYTNGQGDAERMFCAVTLKVTTVIEEILQAGLHVDAQIGREVILSADAE